MGTTIIDGKINCKLHGSITAIDCDSLCGNSCDGCFIYAAFKDVESDDSDFDTPIGCMCQSTGSKHISLN